jgi:HSP20 family molecular chaperone IbpA
MVIERWQPSSELMSLRQTMDNLPGTSFVRPSRSLTTLVRQPYRRWMSYRTASEVVAKASLPAVKPEDDSINITGETFTIQGENKTEREIKKEDHLHQERRYGTLPRSVVLPGGVKTHKADGTMEDGL